MNRTVDIEGLGTLTYYLENSPSLHIDHGIAYGDSGEVWEVNKHLEQIDGLRRVVFCLPYEQVVEFNKKQYKGIRFSVQKGSYGAESRIFIYVECGEYGVSLTDSAKTKILALVTDKLESIFTSEFKEIVQEAKEEYISRALDTLKAVENNVQVTKKHLESLKVSA